MKNAALVSDPGNEVQSVLVDVPDEFHTDQVGEKLIEIGGRDVAEGQHYDPDTDTFFWPFEQLRAEKLNNLAFQHQTVLKQGITFNGAKFPAQGPGRQRVAEIVLGIAVEGRLPKGKPSVALTDLAGAKHQMSPTEVKQLARAASDFIEDTDDRYEELAAEIAGAATEEDLDTIDITTGWPT